MVIFLDPVQFGKYLRDLRKNRKLTLDELGERVQLTKGHLSNIENGRRGIPKTDILFKLSEALNVSYTDLLVHSGHVNLEYIKERQWSHVKDVIIDSLDEVLTEAEAETTTNPESIKEFTDALATSLLETEYNVNNISALKKKLYDENGAPLVGSTTHVERISVLLDALGKSNVEQRKQALNDKLNSLRNDPSPVNDLTRFLRLNNISYNGHPLSAADRQRIAEMLTLLFPNYQPK